MEKTRGSIYLSPKCAFLTLVLWRAISRIDLFLASINSLFHPKLPGFFPLKLTVLHGMLHRDPLILGRTAKLLLLPLDHQAC